MTTETQFSHIPVLLEEVTALFKEQKPARFVDGTIGGGGHSSAILQAVPNAELLGLDRDESALAAAGKRLAQFGGRVSLVHSRYSELAQAAKNRGWDYADAVLLDIGVSSHQIDTPERGFSFRFDAPLDMRMDRTSGLTAADILNQYPEKEIADIIWKYGEEQKSRQIAKAVTARRQTKPWETTGELAELLESVVGRGRQHGLPPATRTFQALRIAVNDELGELERGLSAALDLLSPGGLLAVITFHSLEDRIVKNFLKYQAASCTCPPGLPVCVCGKISTVEILTKKPVRPGDRELSENQRAACSKMRAARKL